MARGYNKKKGLKNKRRKGKKTLTTFFVVIILLILSYSFYYVYTSEYFKIKEIKITDFSYYTEEQVKENVNYLNGSNIVFFSRYKFKKNLLKKMPYIENVKTKIRRNGILEIVLLERTAKYVIINKDTNDYIKVDKNGIMLEKISSTEVGTSQIPLFGLSLGSKEDVGTVIPDTEYTKIQRFEKIYEAYNNSKIEAKVTSVRFENSKIILTLDYKTEVVTEASDNLDYKMNFLKEILKEISGVGGKIDLTLENPTFVEKVG